MLGIVEGRGLLDPLAELAVPPGVLAVRERQAPVEPELTLLSKAQERGFYLRPELNRNADL